MQHLRPIGEQEDNVESILLEVPAIATKGKKKATIMTFKDSTAIPDEFLPPKTELPKDFETQRNIPTSISGFRPDMNPHLRQTLEALEEDAFVDEGLEDDFFAELVKDGEVAAEEELDFPFEERGLDEDGELAEEDEVELGEDDEDWEARFRKFKKGQPKDDDVTSERDHLASEGGDTVGTLPAMSVLGIRKRRKKAGSQASGYSMSSSSMFRNQGLTTLDEQFDKVRISSSLFALCFDNRVFPPSGSREGLRRSPRRRLRLLRLRTRPRPPHIRLRRLRRSRPPHLPRRLRKPPRRIPKRSRNHRLTTQTRT